MTNTALPLAAVLCEDLARGYRPPHEIARLRRCDRPATHTLRDIATAVGMSTAWVSEHKGGRP